MALTCMTFRGVIVVTMCGGYRDGFADGVENVDEDDARLLENVYGIPDF